MKNYKPYSDHQLGIAGSGVGIPIRGRGDLQVASESESAENLGTIRRFIFDLQDVLHPPQVATNPMSLRALDGDGLEYRGKGTRSRRSGGRHASLSRRV